MMHSIHPSQLRAWSLSILRAPHDSLVSFPLNDEVVLAEGSNIIHTAHTCLELVDEVFAPLPMNVSSLPLHDALTTIGDTLEWCSLCVRTRPNASTFDAMEKAAWFADAHALAHRFMREPDLKLLGQLVRARAEFSTRRTQGHARFAFLPLTEVRRALDTALASTPPSLLEKLAESVGLIHLRRTAPTREYQAVCVEGVAEGLAVLRNPSRAHRLERSLRALEGTVDQVLSDLDDLLASSRPILIAGEAPNDITMVSSDVFALSLLSLVAPSGGAFIACVPSLVLPYLQEHLGGTVHPLLLPDGVEPSEVLVPLLAVWSSLAEGLPAHQQLKRVPKALEAALALCAPRPDLSPSL